MANCNLWCTHYFHRPLLLNCGNSILNVGFSQSHAYENIPCHFLQYVHDEQYSGCPNINPLSLLWSSFVSHWCMKTTWRLNSMFNFLNHLCSNNLDREWHEARLNSLYVLEQSCCRVYVLWNLVKVAILVVKLTGKNICRWKAIISSKKTLHS